MPTIITLHDANEPLNTSDLKKMYWSKNLTHGNLRLKRTFGVNMLEYTCKQKTFTEAKKKALSQLFQEILSGTATQNKRTQEHYIIKILGYKHTHRQIYVTARIYCPA